MYRYMCMDRSESEQVRNNANLTKRSSMLTNIESVSSHGVWQMSDFQLSLAAVILVMFFRKVFASSVYSNLTGALAGLPAST
jgi:hypothetical protein